MEWWEIPILALGITIGGAAGTSLSNWIKRKLGWIEQSTPADFHKGPLPPGWMQEAGPTER